jgi:MerR family transcriptional regulator/heat shock protein HspR
MGGRKMTVAVMEERDTMQSEPVMSIGTIAEKVGLSVSALRKYEAGGLIIPHRTPSGHRLFSMEDIDRIKIIQHLIQNVGLNVEGIRRLQALLPCWEILTCPTDIRDACPSFNDIARPCWMIKGLDCAPKGNECRECMVYRFGAHCVEDVKHLLHGRVDIVSASTRIRELVNREKCLKDGE